MLDCSCDSLWNELITQRRFSIWDVRASTAQNPKAPTTTTDPQVRQQLVPPQEEAAEARVDDLGDAVHHSL